MPAREPRLFDFEQNTPRQLSLIPRGEKNFECHPCGRPWPCLGPAMSSVITARSFRSPSTRPAGARPSCRAALADLEEGVGVERRPAAHEAVDIRLGGEGAAVGDAHLQGG